MNTNNKLKLLKKFFSKQTNVAVAFSGGVDSSFLLKIAHDVLNNKVLAITISSPAHSKNEINFARQIAKSMGVKHLIIHSDKLEKDIVKNPVNRCYLCKKEEFKMIINEAKKHGISSVVEGTNIDDKSDYRPGIKAIKELGVFSPLKEYGFTKSEIREQSKKLRLLTWNKPSNPCLMSRFPYDTSITIKKLQIIDQSEMFMSSLGFSNFRVRYHEEIARIEVNSADFQKVLSNRDIILQKFKKLGFKYVCLDIEGFRSGSLNEGLKWIKTN